MSKKKTPPQPDGQPLEHETTAEATVETEAQAADNGQQQAQDDQLEALRRESQANLEGWQRTLAEFQNYKKRTERETRDTYQNATFDVLKNLLPILDDFERAMANVPEDAQAQQWLDGIALIQRKFVKLLEDHQITAVDPVGEPFDPNMHQAIGWDDDTDMESGHVTTTLQKGYVSGERVLRPAVVKVAK